MALTSKKAPRTNHNTASEEGRQDQAKQKASVQSQAKETGKKKAKTTETAHQQHDARPEGENRPQGLTHIIAPKALEAEDDDVRRISEEFALRWSLEAEQHVNGKSAEYIRLVTNSAYARIYVAEAVLCGAITVIPIGFAEPVEELDKWWCAFKVGDLWFVLRYHDTFIREYELVPAFGPTPGNGGNPPPMTRKQRVQPPQRVGPRQRARRNRDDAQGSRVAVARPPGKAAKAIKKAKKKVDDAKRIIANLYDLVRAELRLRADQFTHDLKHLWRQKRPRLLRSVVQMKRLGSRSLQTLRDIRALVVQMRQEARALAKPFNYSFTGARDVAPETSGPSGRLEMCDAGQSIFPRLRLHSWRWDRGPIAWNEYLFGVDWSLDIFGIREEEQACT